MSNFKRHLTLAGGSDRTVIQRLRYASLPARDLHFRGRCLVRLTPRRARNVYGLVTVLRAHPNGLSVLKRDIEGLRTPRRQWLKLRLICGVLVCTRWGSVMVQWRGFPRG
ncbi:hypothetical protein [Longimicrobium sp.]|jgi:hypothetical protein|uniref:hypothetical protein n=1 Tax=Longimicrobium sp. TaxID=2029185 RepID=UPI002EDA233C